MSEAASPTVVVLNDYCNVNGGASRVALDEAIALANMGVEVIFVGAVGPIAPELRDAPLRTICLEQDELANAGLRPGVMVQGLWNRDAYKAVATLLRGLDPARTVVHLHGYTKALTTSPVRAAARAGFPVICTLHDFFAACPNGGFFDYTVRAPCPRTPLSFDCVSTNCDKRHYAHKLYRVGRSLVQRGPGLLPRGVHHYISLSKGSEQIMRQYLPPEAHYYPLENISEVPRQPPVDAAANRDLVAVGRLDIEKGIEVLLQAAGQAGMNLVLVGDGPLRAQAEQSGICRVTGWLSPAQVMAEIEKARCLLFPSIWYETYGLVVAEAAARGVPAIVSNISAAAERMEDGVHGWLVRAGDVEDLKRCLLLTRDDAAIRHMGQAAYERFWSNPPTRQAHVAGLMEIYERVLLASPEKASDAA